jgi:hypothetical protein
MHFGPLIAGMHVITESADADESEKPSHWIEGEHLCIADGCIEMLADDRYGFPDGLGLNSCPSLIVLNCEGTILQINKFDEVAFWKLLSQA